MLTTMKAVVLLIWTMTPTGTVRPGTAFFEDQKESPYKTAMQVCEESVGVIAKQPDVRGVSECLEVLPAFERTRLPRLRKP